ncbi:MAG: tRNA lysidine(34) synthetase TilS [Elusimicrobia bacterium]|nr:tRNA lysidine(34) synthetase TilS [Elusimicrobiota bacterium]
MPHGWDLYPSFFETLKSLLGDKPRRLLAAVSGGPDSMALWDLLERWRKQAGGSYAIGHVDHGLRGKASRADASFVLRRARIWGVPCIIARAPVRAWARKHRRGLEESARILRYQALARMARSQGCAVVLTAHTQNDQVETVFLNLIRGSGPPGLGGMNPAADWPWPAAGAGLKLLRPLLDVERREILGYLRRRRIPFRVDATNRQPLFFRNQIRPILTKWEKLRPGFFERVARLAEIQRDEETFWLDLLKKTSPRLIRPLRSAAGTVGGPEGRRLLRPLRSAAGTVGGPEGRRLLRPRKDASAALDLGLFFRYHKAKQRRILRSLIDFLDFRAVERLRSFAKTSPAGQTVHLPGGWVEKSARFLIFHQKESRANPPPERPSRHPFSSRRSCRIPVPGRISIEPASSRSRALWEFRTRFVAAPPPGWKRRSNRIYTDGDRLSISSLRCRAWRPGDRFTPLGLKGRKKLQDFFVDEKVPPEERARVPLLEDRRGIVWVVGHRLSDRVKLTPSTRRILEIAAEKRAP